MLDNTHKACKQKELWRSEIDTVYHMLTPLLKMLDTSGRPLCGQRAAACTLRRWRLILVC